MSHWGLSCVTPWAPSGSAFQWSHYTISQEKIKLHKYITYDPENGSFAELLSCVFHSRRIVLFITVCQCDSSIILLFTVLPFSSAVKMKRKSMPLKRIMTNSPPARSVLIYLFFSEFSSPNVLAQMWWKNGEKLQESTTAKERNTVVGHHICKRLRTILCPASPPSPLAFSEICCMIRNVREGAREDQIKWHRRQGELVQFCTNQITLRLQ